MNEVYSQRNNFSKEDSQRKSAEVAFVNPLEIFRQFVDAVSDYAIFSLDKSGNILTWNNGAARLKGYSAEEIIGKNFSIFYTPEDLAKKLPDDELKTAVLTGKSENEGWRIKKDGSKFWANVIINKLKDEEGNFVGFFKITHDLTSSKKLEEKMFELNESLENRVRERTLELRKLADRLEDDLKSRDVFITLVSHELNTPLTALKLQTQLRNRHLNAKGMSAFPFDRIKKLFDDDVRQVDRLSRLVEDMLDMASLKSGEVFLRPEKIDLSLIIRNAAKKFTAQLAQAGCEFTILANEDVEGEWDSYRIEQVFNNLLSNAMKYGAKKPIHVQVTKSANSALLIIQDYGEGIALQNQERVFYQFERASSGEVSGLGLGLYIAKEIVKAHHGSISLESKLGEGSRFTVELPLNFHKKNEE